MSLYAEIRAIERQLEACTDPVKREQLLREQDMLQAAARDEAREEMAETLRAHRVPMPWGDE